MRGSDMVYFVVVGGGVDEGFYFFGVGVVLEVSVDGGSFIELFAWTL